MNELMTERGLDLAAVRTQLNEQTFREGHRRLVVGLIPELFVDVPADEVARRIMQMEQQLSELDLWLERSHDIPDQLVIVQNLKHRQTDPNAMARAMQWVARITTVGLEMVIPAVVGGWLDAHFETSFLVVIGLLIGVPLGLWHLLQMTRR